MKFLINYEFERKILLSSLFFLWPHFDTQCEATEKHILHANKNTKKIIPAFGNFVIYFEAPLFFTVRMPRASCLGALDYGFGAPVGGYNAVCMAAPEHA